MGGRGSGAFFRLADVLSTYGNVLGRPITYLEFCGLVWNRPRALFRQSLATALGIAVAMGGDHPKDWFTHLTDSNREAEEAQAEARAARAVARR